jgi:hypothetical protein
MLQFFFCLLRAPLINVYSPNCELLVCWEFFHLEIYVQVCVDTFYQIRISPRYRTETQIHVSLK